MEILRNYDLTKLNTLGVSAHSKEFVEINFEAELKELFNSEEFKQNQKIFLGGGSNVLFTKDFDGMILLNKIKGIEILQEDAWHVIIKSMSGEIWHDLVSFAVNRGYWGIENLSLIPGTVGGAPVQNIGAYGAELKDILENVEAYNTQDGSKRIFKAGDCELGYRDSIFKNRLKGQYFISAVTFKLSKIKKPNLSYKILSDYLEERKIEVKSSKDVSDAVSAIRSSKLPDPKVIPNAGSFFKNVFAEEKELEELIKKHPDMPYFKEGKKTKIPSAWLIEQCGYKGRRAGNVGVHDKHALVLVNYGGGTGKEIENLAKEIIDSVFAKFGLKLAPEVNLI
ncbi:MAG TPA: UDP-N-acetylmuramate dehydrogenase [Candidatus Paceibacterota bacterium]|jgi:UDP-N-acetylmuramate dehydrogenase|nr:UDP-N-acetylmuramate dehydrogenase [Candidatus Paceibacterota bacterium]